MQTQPCGHRVVCRLCFVKTIQATVSQRTLPLRCVVCRTKILKLKQSVPSRLPSTPLTTRLFRPSQGSSSATSPALVAQRPRRSHSSVPSTGTSSANTTSSTAAGLGVGAGTSYGAASVCRAPASATSSSPRHAPTATKLIQPLLIYPASSVPQSSTSSAYHCGHHRMPPNHCHHHHHHHGHQSQQQAQQQQQQQQPIRVMAAWSGDGTSFDSSHEPALNAVASSSSSAGADCSGSGCGSMTAVVAGDHLHRRTGDGEMERGRVRGVRHGGGLPRASGESSPAPRHLTSVYGCQANSSSLPPRERRR